MCLYLFLPSYCIPSLVGLRRELSLILAAPASNGAVVWSPERRVARVQRETKETSVAVDLNLDGTGRADNQSGIHFLDHMLDVSTHPHHGQGTLVSERQGQGLIRAGVKGEDRGPTGRV